MTWMQHHQRQIMILQVIVGYYDLGDTVTGARLSDMGIGYEDVFEFVDTGHLFMICDQDAAFTPTEQGRYLYELSRAMERLTMQDIADVIGGIVDRRG